jgi:hypothetical protein
MSFIHPAIGAGAHHEGEHGNRRHVRRESTDAEGSLLFAPIALLFVAIGGVP